MTFEFDAGTFTLTLENPRVRDEESGSCVLDGDTLTLAFESRYPQEVFTYQWGLDGDTLTPGRIPDLEGPTPFIVKPWTRVPGEAMLEVLERQSRRAGACPTTADRPSLVGVSAVTCLGMADLTGHVEQLSGDS